MCESSGKRTAKAPSPTSRRRAAPRPAPAAAAAAHALLPPLLLLFLPLPLPRLRLLPLLLGLWPEPAASMVGAAGRAAAPGMAAAALFATSRCCATFALVGGRSRSSCQGLGQRPLQHQTQHQRRIGYASPPTAGVRPEPRPPIAAAGASIVWRMVLVPMVVVATLVASVRACGLVWMER